LPLVPLIGAAISLPSTVYGQPDGCRRILRILGRHPAGRLGARKRLYRILRNLPADSGEWFLVPP
jgi:hypothetical protein